MTFDQLSLLRTIVLLDILLLDILLSHGAGIASACDVWSMCVKEQFDGTFADGHTYIKSNEDLRPPKNKFGKIKWKATEFDSSLLTLVLTAALLDLV